VFLGTYQHAIDAKGRTSLPAKFREQVVAKGAECVWVTKGPGHSLWVYAPQDFEAQLAQLTKKSAFDQKVRDFVNAFASPAQECPFDKLGRVLVPPMLRAHAGLEGEVVWAGAIGHIELWSEKRWAERSEAVASVLESDPLAGLGADETRGK
jgi:MraZ protein